jgi:hypothetical protein
MTPKLTLIGYALDRIYSFNLKKEHHTKTGKQIHRTKTEQPNTSYKDGKSKPTNM